jgi:hypothetical protein
MAEALTDHEAQVRGIYPYVYVVVETKFSTEVKIVQTEINFIVEVLGFRRFDYKNGDRCFVQINNNVIQQVDLIQIRDAFVEWLREQPNEYFQNVGLSSVLNKILGGVSTYFSEDKLNFISKIKEDKILRHDRETMFFPFANGVVEIQKRKGEKGYQTGKPTKKTYKNAPLLKYYTDKPRRKIQPISLIEYKNLKGYVWHDMVIPRVLNVLNWRQMKNSEWLKFTYNISVGHDKKNASRWADLRKITGYLLHDYFFVKRKAIIFTDSRTEEADGRSGKSLYVDALLRLLNGYIQSAGLSIDGKSLKLGSGFGFQEMSKKTKFIHINDVYAGIDFEQLFTMVTEGVKPEYKYVQKNPEYIHCKFAISTNRTIRVVTPSARDRTLFFQTADFFSENYTPQMEHKQYFFAENWPEYEWDSFYSYLLICCHEWLNTLTLPNTNNATLDLRMRKEQTCPEFIDFMEDELTNEAKQTYKRIEFVSEEDHNQDKKKGRYEKRSAYQQFMDLFPDVQIGKMNQKVSQRLFTSWLKFYSQYSGAKLVEERSNGIDYFTIVKKKKYSDEVPF